jgi:Arc/MetJ-type ribon-helix-helix transcriptional regulator
MTVKLKPSLERRVAARVERGGYESAEALVEQAVEQLIEGDEAEEACRADILRRITAANGEIDRGDFVEYDASNIHELAKDIQERGLKRLRSG